MSRYLILIILNVPLIIAGVVNAIVSFNLHHTSRRSAFLKIILWLAILAGILFAEPIYEFLFSHNLTQTEPLSLFDVIQITGIIFTFFIASRAFSKADALERRVQELHQELSIRLATQSSKKTSKS